MLEAISPGQGVQSLGIYGDASHPGRYRAAVESVLVFRVMTQLNCLLEKDGFLGSQYHFINSICLYKGYPILLLEGKCPAEFSST